MDWEAGNFPSPASQSTVENTSLLDYDDDNSSKVVSAMIVQQPQIESNFWSSMTHHPTHPLH